MEWGIFSSTSFVEFQEKFNEAEPERVNKRSQTAEKQIQYMENSKENNTDNESERCANNTRD